MEIKADFLIIDELASRNVAEENGLKLVGLLSCLLRAKQQGHLTEVKTWMELLISKVGFRVNPKLYQHILKLAGE